MAQQASVKTIVRRISEAAERLAASQGWGPDDFKVFVRINREWGYVHVIFVARNFPFQTERENWELIMGYLQGALWEDGRRPGISISLTLRTFEQVDQGGIYTLSPSFVDVDEILAGGVA